MPFSSHKILPPRVLTPLHGWCGSSSSGSSSTVSSSHSRTVTVKQCGPALASLTVGFPGEPVKKRREIKRPISGPHKCGQMLGKMGVCVCLQVCNESLTHSHRHRQPAFLSCSQEIGKEQEFIHGKFFPLFESQRNPILLRSWKKARDDWYRGVRGRGMGSSTARQQTYFFLRFPTIPSLFLPSLLHRCVCVCAGVCDAPSFGAVYCRAWEFFFFFLFRFVWPKES